MRTGTARKGKAPIRPRGERIEIRLTFSRMRDAAIGSRAFGEMHLHIWFLIFYPLPSRYAAQFCCMTSPSPLDRRDSPQPRGDGSSPRRRRHAKSIGERPSSLANPRVEGRSETRPDPAQRTMQAAHRLAPTHLAMGHIPNRKVP
jgi:hypothetical protein